MRSVAAAILISVAISGCGEGTGLEVADLEGTWVASVYQYTDNGNSQNVVDIIQRDGATFTLTVDAGGTASSLLDDGLGSMSSDSGTLDSGTNRLTLGGVVFEAQRNGGVLTLVDTDSSFDFGSGSTSAALRIVMNRN